MQTELRTGTLASRRRGEGRIGRVLGAAWAASLVALALAACLPPESEEDKDPLVGSGDLCGKGVGECRAGLCSAGRCTGGRCGDGERCADGWDCNIPEPDFFNPFPETGPCQLPCGDGCPSGWVCNGGYCGAPPATVTIEGPTELAKDDEVTYRAVIVGNENDPVDRITWHFWGGATGAEEVELEGEEITWSPGEAGRFQLEVDADLEVGWLSAEIRIAVCQTEGGACDRGPVTCCEGLACSGSSASSSVCEPSP
jgi:hypothetical protein